MPDKLSSGTQSEYRWPRGFDAAANANANAIALRLNFHVNRTRRYNRIVPFSKPLRLGPGRLGFASPIRLPST